MAKFMFDVRGLDGLETIFENINGTRYVDGGDVIEKMLNAEADVVIRTQKQTAKTMLQGPQNKGAVAGAVAKAKMVRRQDGSRTLPITFDGEQHGNRIAEIAFVNEYGKRGQGPRAFVRAACDACADEAAAAAEKVFDEWLEQF